MQPDPHRGRQSRPCSLTTSCARRSGPEQQTTSLRLGEAGDRVACAATEVDDDGRVGLPAEVATPIRQIKSPRPMKKVPRPNHGRRSLLGKAPRVVPCGTHVAPAPPIGRGCRGRTLPRRGGGRGEGTPSPRDGVGEAPRVVPPTTRGPIGGGATRSPAGASPLSHPTAAPAGTGQTAPSVVQQRTMSRTERMPTDSPPSMTIRCRKPPRTIAAAASSSDQSGAA